MTINLAAAARVVASARNTHPVTFNAIGHCLVSVAAMAVGSGEFGAGKLRQLLFTSLLATALVGCSYSVGRDGIAYKGCIVRHPQEALVCDAPQQAYEFDWTEFQATAAPMSHPVGSIYAQR
jgi:hypothetical protein